MTTTRDIFTLPSSGAPHGSGESVVWRRTQGYEASQTGNTAWNL